MRRRDLVRIRERLEGAPPPSSFWGNAGWVFFSLSGGTAITAVTLAPGSPMPLPFMAILAVFLLFVAGLCGIFQLNLNEEQRRGHEDALADLDETIGEPGG